MLRITTILSFGTHIRWISGLQNVAHSRLVAIRCFYLDRLGFLNRGVWHKARAIPHNVRSGMANLYSFASTSTV